MKSCWSILILAGVLALSAQTNSSTSEPNGEPTAAKELAAAPTNSPAATNAVPERPPTEIFSDSANFDWKGRIAVYIGHVRVVDPQMKLSCGILTAHVPESGKLDSIVAKDNVVIDAVDDKGKPVHATADKAVYSYAVANSVTNETMTLSGDPPPQVEKEGGLLTGDTITWDFMNHSFSATHQHTVFQPQTMKSNTMLPSPKTEKR
jgi:lipopolysaccharide transport protein LptA